MVYDILTKKNTLTNYSTNSNGIFFSLNDIPKESIKELEKRLDEYFQSKKQSLEYETKRSKIFDQMKNNTSTEKEISDFCSNNHKRNVSFSTKIDDFSDITSEKDNTTYCSDTSYQYFNQDTSYVHDLSDLDEEELFGNESE
ncbi:MAG TPA: hypothetical protein V6C58_03595 [Allocoleopsis sp.]